MSGLVVVEVGEICKKTKATVHNGRYTGNRQPMSFMICALNSSSGHESHTTQNRSRGHRLALFGNDEKLPPPCSIYRYAHIHTQTHTHTHTLSLSLYIYTYEHMHAHIHTHIYIYGHTHTYIYIYGHTSLRFENLRYKRCIYIYL